MTLNREFTKGLEQAIAQLKADGVYKTLNYLDSPQSARVTMDCFFCRYSTPTARCCSKTTRVTCAWLSMVRFGRERIGRKYAAAALQRRPL